MLCCRLCAALAVVAGGSRVFSTAASNYIVHLVDLEGALHGNIWLLGVEQETTHTAIKNSRHLTRCFSLRLEALYLVRDPARQETRVCLLCPNESLLCPNENYSPSTRATAFLRRK